ncbi:MULTISPECIES: hypothetical protein [Halorussus]|uniref:hypothetical protein n=1 Tax=Halorussus TaxID=1070314 RepID=UPI00209DC863|nr:hypothetical protein [Halorussus vallis]USZ76778.1 hypothetical protein NGM07_05485 [Halorussus vallis]
MTDSSGPFGQAEYLCYRLLVRLDDSRSTATSRSKFNKLSCIADRYLQSELGHDIEFPRYWYVYGEVVDEPSLDRSFYNAPAAKFWSGQQYFPADDVSDWDFAVEDREKRYIDEAVRWTVGKFERQNTDQIKRYQYREFVPNRFIRAYSELRSQLKRVDLDEQRTLGDFQAADRSRRESVVAALDEMATTYPREDYPEAFELFRSWNDTVRLLLDDDPNYAVVEAFLDSFITTLSKVELRFHHRRNIPDARIKAWEDERLEVKEAFRSNLAEKRRELLAARRDSAVRALSDYGPEV